MNGFDEDDYDDEDDGDAGDTGPSSSLTCLSRCCWDR